MKIGLNEISILGSRRVSYDDSHIVRIPLKLEMRYIPQLATFSMTETTGIGTTSSVTYVSNSATSSAGIIAAVATTPTIEYQGVNSAVMNLMGTATTPQMEHHGLSTLPSILGGITRQTSTPFITTTAVSPLGGFVNSTLLDGLIEWWDGENAVGEHAGITLDLVNNAVYGAGKVGNCFTAVSNGSGRWKLDNGDASPLQLGTSDMTLAFWLDPDTGNSGNRGIVSFGNGQNSEGWEIRSTTSGTILAFYLHNGTTNKTLSGTITPGSFMLVIVTLDRDGNGIIKVNDSVIATTDISSFVSDDIQSAAEFRVGYSGASQVSDNKIDSLAIWNRVLTSSEQTELLGTSNTGLGYRNLYGPLTGPTDTLTLTMGVTDAQEQQVNLNQTYSWQVTLRDHLNTYTYDDFVCGLPGLSYDDAWLTTDDEVYRLWLTFENLGRGITNIFGVRMDPTHYVLANIERNNTVYMRFYGGATNPSCMAWLYQWDWQGNPYFEMDTVANRALAATMVDMIMIRNSSRSSQSDASSFLMHAYVYTHCGHLLPTNVQTAYKECLEYFFDYFESVVSSGIQADLDLPNVAGMILAGEILGPSYVTRAYDHMNAFLTKHFQPAQFIDHGAGYDPTYHGWSIRYLLTAYMVSGYSELSTALNDYAELKGYMSFYDTGLDVWKGPSNFSTNTAGGAPNDQVDDYGRNIAFSFVAENAEYLRYTGKIVAGWLSPYGIKDVSTMRSELADWTNRMSDAESYSQPNDTYGTWGRVYDYTMPVWTREWHMQTPNLQWELYPGAGTYATNVSEEGSKLPPFSDTPDFVKSFNDDFIFWKLNGFGGLIHVSPLSWWSASTNMPGFSGGSISTLWDETGGLFLLGRNRGYAGSTPDTWANSQSWAVQHVWGKIGSTPYSSGRQRTPTATISTTSNTISVNVVGEIEPDSTYNYERDIQVTSDSVVVNTTVTDYANFDEIWEVFPLFLGLSTGTLDDIEFLVSASWEAATTTPVSADAVRITRNGVTLQIEFTSTESVKLADDIWSTTYDVTTERMRSVMIDLSNTGTTEYTINNPNA